MSLINEALERAREEAVRRRSAGRGIPLHSPPRADTGDRTWWKVAAGLMAVALAVSLLAIGLIFLNGRSTGGAVARRTVPVEPAASMAAEAPRPDPAAPEAVTMFEPPAPTPPAEDAGRIAGSRPAPAVPAGEPEETRIEKTPAREARPRPEPAPGTTRPATSSQPPARLPDSASPNVAESTPPRVSTFLQRARLADGTDLELAGIVWSESGPFALLNGRVVGIREVVEGYAVIGISQEVVELEGEVGTVIIRLK